VQLLRHGDLFDGSRRPELTPNMRVDSDAQDDSTVRNSGPLAGDFQTGDSLCMLEIK
jgi:hypothetical protein